MRDLLSPINQITSSQGESNSFTGDSHGNRRPFSNFICPLVSFYIPNGIAFGQHRKFVPHPEVRFCLFFSDFHLSCDVSEAKLLFKFLDLIASRLRFGLSLCKCLFENSLKQKTIIPRGVLLQCTPFFSLCCIEFSTDFLVLLVSRLNYSLQFFEVLTR